MGCAHTNYTGKPNNSSVFQVKATMGAVLGEHNTTSPGSRYTYYSRGRYTAGTVTFQAATEVGIEEDEESEHIIYDNFRTVTFTGVAGHEYQLRPIPVTGTALMGVVSLSREYQGYDVLDQSTGVIVARVP